MKKTAYLDLNLKISQKTFSGQAILLVLLGMAVVLTIVISVASRSVTDVSITQTEEESSKAFSAAEAGIENFLSGGVTSGSLTESEASFSVVSSDLGAGAIVNFADFGASYRNGDVATLWFVSHDDNDPSKMTCTGKPCFGGGSFNLCWGSGSDSPALEVAVYYGNRTDIFTGNYSSLKVKRYALDPVSNRSSGFISPVSGCQGYSYGADISSLPSDLIFARIRFIYNNNPQSFAVVAPSGSGQTFPSQGRRISSLGTAGQSSRRVEMIELYRDPLPILEAALVGRGDISK